MSAVASGTRRVGWAAGADRWIRVHHAGSTNVEFKSNVQLDGRDALHVWSVNKNAGDAHTIQFVAINAGKLYVLTVSTNRDLAEATTLSEQIVSGWKWTAG